MERVLRNYNLGVILLTLFLLSWAGQAIFQWQEFVQTQQEHNQPIEINAFVPEFLSRTFENWQSEFLQLLSFVVLTGFFIFKGSPESKDSDEKIEQKLSKIEKKLGKK